MKSNTVMLGLALLMLCTPLLADDDCDDPVTHWQPRENLRQKLEAESWTVYRIKVDDGCYEAKGQLLGRYYVEASFTPASLTLMKLELKRESSAFEDDFESSYGNLMRGAMPSADAETGNGNPAAPRRGVIQGRPNVSVE